MESDGDLDLSICVITLNEEKCLSRCLESLPRGCEIIILDSGSTDRTLSIAKKYGAKIFERPFDDYASQKNAALEKATKTWVLSIDADEELSPALRDMLTKGLPHLTDCYFSIQRRLVFMGRQMRFGKTSDQPIRIGPRGKVNFVGKVHEVLTPIEPLILKRVTTGHLLHRSYEDLNDYFDKFNRYTSQIALRKFERGTGDAPLLQTCLRPWWEFLQRYFLRLGLLDGYPGYCYALVSSLYGFVKYAKYLELVGNSDRDGKTYH